MFKMTARTESPFNPFRGSAIDGRLLSILCAFSLLAGCEHVRETQRIYISYKSCIVQGVSSREVEDFATSNAMQAFQDWPEFGQTNYPNLFPLDSLNKLADREGHPEMKDLLTYRISILPSSDNHNTYVLYHPTFKILIIIYEDIP